MRELDLQKAKTVDKSKQKYDAKNAKPKSILESFEYIVELAEDSNYNFHPKYVSFYQWLVKISSTA